MLEPLGRGGMATVYRADDLKHDRQVALKVLHEELAATLGPERFLREIRVTAKLHHPHILPLLDSGDADGLLYYVMPVVDGESLRQRVARESRLPLDEALEITRTVGTALAYAHAQDVVHRDIKPENILFVAGQAAVSDFGIAWAVDVSGGDALTQTGMAIGTPAYMSPEQVGGDPVDGRSDLYALACVLYEMLAGRTPFAGPSVMAILARKATDAAPRLSAIRQAIPRPIEHAVSRALASDPDDRFASVEQFLDALKPRGRPRWSAPERAVDTSATVAVLPFASMTTDVDDEYLSDGISEEIIHRLSRVEGLHVVARTSAFAFKGRQDDIRTIGERLNVRHVVEGSVRRAGKRLRVTAQLVSTHDGYQLWSERYDRLLDDVFEVQDDISAAIASKLRTLVGATGAPPPSAPARGTSFAAYEHYLKGRHFWNRRTPDGLRRSIEWMERALAEDPDFAHAHAGLADACVMLGLYGIEPAMEVMPRAKAAAERALGLQDSLAEALSALACVAVLYEWDHDRGYATFRQAVTADPNYPTGHQWYAMALVPQRRFDEAREALVRAQTLDPLSLSIAASRAALAYYEREYDEAAARAREALELDPRFGMAHYFLGQAASAAGRGEEAVAALRDAVEFTGGTAESHAALVQALADDGQVHAAREAAGELTRLARHQYVSPVLFARIAAALGEFDAAIDRLREAYDARATDLVWIALRAEFDALRGHEAFAGILNGMGLPD